MVKDDCETNPFHIHPIQSDELGRFKKIQVSTDPSLSFIGPSNFTYWRLPTTCESTEGLEDHFPISTKT